MAEAFADAGRPEKAISAFAAMWAAGIMPEVRLQRKLLTAFLHAGQREEAVVFYRQLEARGCPMEDGFRAKVMKICGQLNLVEVAEGVLETTRAAGNTPSKAMYFALARIYQDRGRDDEAHILLAEMKRTIE
eukprot:TRINITY_DN24225_c0_g1_i1.p1 TRINITY_DN24225_c0_g1~~TRINITY_DN24225_c0_g1_i1.p1  ORF type:complete len:150 (+),score=33.52 TRINITY_DN24225_c0_g1_i1:57-452(+)